MTEDKIEQLTIARLRNLGYSCQHGPGIALDHKQPERVSIARMLLDAMKELWTSRPLLVALSLVDL